MRARGIAEAHARDYTLVGCAQVVSQGRCCGGHEDLIVSILKALELALHDGIDPMSGERLGPATGAPASFESYAAFEAAVLRQVDALIENATAAANRQYMAMTDQCPDLHKSLLIEGCLEQGRDYRRGGALYTEGLADVLGITNLADSLLVIRRLVYEEGRLSLPELVAALDADWAGHEALRQECLRRVPKFGNDDPAADELTVRLFNHINDAFRARPRAFGNAYGIDVIGWTGAVIWGKLSGATPDGRHSRSSLTDSVGASQGQDRAGVTAALRSVAGLPHDRCHGVLAMNLRFARQSLEGEAAADRLVELADTAFDMGLQQLQINVVDGRTLRDAQAHPERYESLMVRIGGFSTYFNSLSREYQDDIIARTEHAL
jgi:formate C-acetyltransferase